MKTFWIVFAVIAGLLLVAILTAGIWLEPIVHDQLEQIVSEQSDNQYQLDVENVEISIFGGSIGLEDVKLKAKGANLHEAAQLTGGLILEGSSEELRLSGVGLWTLVWQGRVDADSLLIIAPDVMATLYDTGSATNARQSSDSTTTATKLPAKIQVAGVRLADGHFDFGSITDSISSEIHFDNVDANLAELRLDSLTLNHRPDKAFANFSARVGAYRHELGDSVHTVTLRSALFESTKGLLTIDSVAINPKYEGFNFVDTTFNSRFALTLTSDTVRMEGFELDLFLRKQIYRARSLRVADCEAEVYVEARRIGQGDAQNPAGFNLDIFVDTVALEAISLRYHGLDPQLDITFPDADLVLLDVQTSVAREGQQDLFDVAKAQVDFRNFEYQPDPDGLVLNVAHGSLDYGVKSLTIHDLRYAPENESRSILNERATLAIELDTLLLSELDMEALFWDRQLIAKTAEVANFELRSITNFGIEGSPPQRPIIILQELNQLAFAIEIDEVLARNADISYRRLLENGKDVTLSWENTYATITHVGTSTTYAKEHPRANAIIKTDFEDMLPVDVNISWPNAKGVPYVLQASTGSLDLMRINDFLVPIANMKVEQGALNKLSFNFTADEQAGRGSLVADYENFKINMLESGTSTDDKDIISFFANLAAVDEDNSSGTTGGRGRISADRERSESMWAHWWMLIRSGLRQVVLTDFGRKRTATDRDAGE